MAVAVEHFGNTTHYAPLIYSDASFLFDLYEATVPPATGPGRRAALSYAFFGRATAAGSSFVVSTLGFEELIHRLLFRPVDAAAAMKGHRDWKAYKANDAAGFNADYARGLTKATSAYSAVRTAGVVHLKDSPSAKVVLEGDPRLTRYALALCNRGAIGGMDAFHVAVAREAGIDWIVSCDRDFGSVPTISLYAP